MRLAETDARRRVAAKTAFCLALGLCWFLGARPAKAQDAFTVMASDPRFSHWVALVQSSGLQEYARGAAPYTVFVPVDSAFDNVPADIRSDLEPTGQNRPSAATLQTTVVRSHVIRGMHPLADFSGKTTSLTTVNGLPLVVDGTDPASLKVKFNFAEGHTIGEPIKADNAIIYPVDIVSAHR